MGDVGGVGEQGKEQRHRVKGRAKRQALKGGDALHHSDDGWISEGGQRGSNDRSA